MKSHITLYAQLLCLPAVLMMAVSYNLVVGGLHREVKDITWHVNGADAERGRQRLHDYACGACHVIPGVRGAGGRVGPRLDALTKKMYIAGALSGTPSNLSLWIRAPESVNPKTAMPNLGLSEEEALDIAAYLYRAR